MSLRARMRDRVTVHVRTRGEDDWAQVGGPLAALITRLRADGQRRESNLPEPDVTHMVRLPLSAREAVVAGRRLRRVTDDAEWLVRFVRVHDGPVQAGHVAAGCAEVEGTVGD